MSWRLEEARANASFQLVMPGYLPDDFELSMLLHMPLALPGRERSSMVFMRFASESSDGFIFLRETGPADRIPAPPPDENWTAVELKGVRILVDEGTATISRPPGASRDVPSVQAIWNYGGVSFQLEAVEVSWEEAERVIASMIE
ncbi:MAG: hypothetical protein HY673_06590 [Chloroflexi bacterium]|nr:hypothetical protein [Chloroflexota bacterium]